VAGLVLGSIFYTSDVRCRSTWRRYWTPSWPDQLTTGQLTSLLDNRRLKVVIDVLVISWIQLLAVPMRAVDTPPAVNLRYCSLSINSWVTECNAVFDIKNFQLHILCLFVIIVMLTARDQSVAYSAKLKPGFH